MDDEFLSESKAQRRAVYFEFLGDFREYLQEYIRESVVELKIAEVPVRGELKLFDGLTPCKVKIKNQGSVACYLTTQGIGGYQLDPGESTEIFVNNQVIATTASGVTTLGFIKY